MNQTSISAIIPQRIWDAYRRMRPNEAIPIHPGDHFRLKAGGPLYEVSEILNAPALHAVELI